MVTLIKHLIEKWLCIIDSICIRGTDEIQFVIDELRRIEKKVNRLKALLFLRKIVLAVS